MASKVSEAVIRRLPRYYRLVQTLLDNGIERVSSSELAAQLGYTASQVRQDFSCFGGFGQQGYGYSTVKLRDKLASILNLHGDCSCVIVGAGHMARTLMGNDIFSRHGVRVIALFDRDPELVGQTIGGVSVVESTKLRRFCEEFRPELAVLTCSAEGAQDAADVLMECGVKGIWNFTEVDVETGRHLTAVENVRLADSLMTLCCSIPAIGMARQSQTVPERKTFWALASFVK